LEKTQALQALLFKEEQLYSQRKEKEVDSLRQIEKIQSLELETQQLVQKEQEAQIEILDKENELSELNLKKVRSRNRFMIGIVLLVLIIMYIVYRALRYSKKTNKILIKQNNEIERQRDEIDYQRKRSDDLLLNILPAETAEELKEKGSATPRHYDLVSVLFTDFKGFTIVAEKLTPNELVAELDSCFFAFDKIIDKYNLEKIKTIGDSYMCAGGIPVANATNPEDCVRAGLEIKMYMENLKAEREAKGEPFWELRIGIHTGQVVAGVVGKNKFAYDIWGDAVNTASRMESSGIPGKVNISGVTYELVKDKFACTYRGKVNAKNKGEIDMYIVEGIN
jgi:class 3 adenylate cyclase